MYETPPRELTEQIHETISSLPVHGQEEKIVKKKLSFSVIAAAALMIVLMATALAATNETVNGLLYKYWPDQEILHSWKESLTVPGIMNR